MASVRVAVRVRPIALREQTAGESVVVSVDSEHGQISVTNLKVPEFADYDSRERTRSFGFDVCYDWNAQQDSVFREVGLRVLDALVSGYNACVLAYGQSGTGKTFTMMGRQDQPGLTPRICEALFTRFQAASVSISSPLPALPSLLESTAQPTICHDVTSSHDFHVSVCFLEIHNERVRDLLAAPGHAATPLRVREHPRKGPYVQGLSEHVANNATSLMSLLAAGNARRCTARSGEHTRSSRSHAVFTVNCTHAGSSRRAHLVDLAGSERSESTSRARREEGASINKSLVTLGNVISALAERPRCCQHGGAGGSSQVVTRGTGAGRCGHAHVYVPYRDSVLTWLLRDALGGNAKTYMIATVSPASGCYGETVNTLRYAQRAKRIVNQPVVSTAPLSGQEAVIIRELRAEVARLRAVLAALQGNGAIKQQVPWVPGEDSLVRRWLTNWHTMQRGETTTPATVSSLTAIRSSQHAGNERWNQYGTIWRAYRMGQRFSTEQPRPEEAKEVTEQQRDTLMPLFEDQSRPGDNTVLRRASSTCELVYRRPYRGRIARRYASHDSLPADPQPLSPGGSENSLASSSSSVESQKSLDSRLHRAVTGATNAYKKKVFKSSIPVRIPTTSSSSPSTESLRRNSTSSVPDLSKIQHPPKQKQADIIAAVTQRLYPKKRLHSNDTSDSSKDSVKDETGSSDSSSRTSSRLRLFDLSKRLLAQRQKELISKTEAETQTEKDTSEAAVGTEKALQQEPIHAFITSEVFLPSVCLHQCSLGRAGAPPDLLACPQHEEAAAVRSSSRSRSVSMELPSCCDDDCFSDDSLEGSRNLDTVSPEVEKPCLWKVVHLHSGHDFIGTESSSSSKRDVNSNSKRTQQADDNSAQTKNTAVVIEGEMPAEDNWEVNVVIGDDSDLENSSVNFKISNENIDTEPPLFNGLPLSSEESEPSRPPSSDDNNSCPSPVSSEAASSDSSGDDFVYFLQAPEETGPNARRLYTIAENSEHSDPSESLEPSPSPSPQRAPCIDTPTSRDDEIIQLESPKTTQSTTFSLENIFSKYSTSHNVVSFPLNITAPSTESYDWNSKNFYPEFTKGVTPMATSRAQTVLTSSLLTPRSSVTQCETAVSLDSSQSKLSDSITNVSNIRFADPLTCPFVPLNSPTLVSRSQDPNLNQKSLNVPVSNPINISNSYDKLGEKSGSLSPNLINLNTPSPDLMKFSQPDLTLHQTPENLNGNLNLLSPELKQFHPSSDNEAVNFLLPKQNCSPLSLDSDWSKNTFPSRAVNNINLSSPQSISQHFPSKQTISMDSQQPRSLPPTLIPSSSAWGSTRSGAVPRTSREDARHANVLVNVSQQYSTLPVDSTPKAMRQPARSTDPERTSVTGSASVQWTDPRQRQFLNVSVLPGRAPNQGACSVQQRSDPIAVNSASEDSITFVFVGPARKHAPPVLLELVRRSVGGRGLQRSVSLDSATRALARLGPQRRRGDVLRGACSVDTLVPEETHAFLEPARREHNGGATVAPRRFHRRDSSPSDSEVRSTDEDFEDASPPELPRITGQTAPVERAKQPWLTDMKGLILGQPQSRSRPSPSPPPPPRSRTVGKKAVSWSDVSGCGILSSPSSHSLPSPTSLASSPKPIIKKSTLAPVPQSPIPSPPPLRLPQNRSPENSSLRDRLHLDLQSSPPWNLKFEQTRSSPDYRMRSEVDRLSPDYHSEWCRERSMSAPSSPYREPWSYSRLREERSSSPSPECCRGASVSAPSTPLWGSPVDAPRYCRSRSPPRCSSESRCRSLGDVSELGRDAESLRMFLVQANTLLHSLSDLSRLLEQQPTQQKSKERAVQTEEDVSSCSCFKPELKKCEGTRNSSSTCHKTDPIPIQKPHGHHHCCHERVPQHCCCCPGHSWYEPSPLEQQLEASCARLEASLQEPPDWQNLGEPQHNIGQRRPARNMQPLSTASTGSVSWRAPLSLPPRSPRLPHFSPRAYMRHLLGVRRRIIQASRVTTNPELP